MGVLIFLLSFFLWSEIVSPIFGQSKFRTDSYVEEQNITKILDSMLENYDYRIRPDYGGRPVNVNMTLYVLTFHKLDEKSKEFTLQAYFRRQWLDPRLRFSSDKGMLLDGDHGIKVWHPDLFIVNEIDVKSHKFAKENQLLMLSPNGTIKISERATVTSSCIMELQYFPFDSQVCSLEIESFGHSTTDIVLQWALGPLQSVGVSSDATGANGLIFVGHRISDTVIELKSGNYSRAWVEFVFKRNYTWHIWTIFVPLTFLSILTIVPLLSTFQFSGPGWNLLPTCLSYVLGLWLYKDLDYANDYMYARAYIYLNWVFAFMTLIGWIATSYSSNTANLKAVNDQHKKLLKLTDLLWKEISAIIAITILIGMNSVYWACLVSHYLSSEDSKALGLILA